MSDDKTRLGNDGPGAPGRPNDASGAPLPQGAVISRQPEDATFVGAAPAPVRKTIVGVSSPPTIQRTAQAATIVAGNAGTPLPLPAQSMQPLPAQPGTMAKGTPLPLSQPPSHTMQAQPRAKRSSEAPSQGPGKSSWDTFDGASTGVHATSAMPHPGVRINQYEMIKMIGEGGMGTVFLARDLRLGRRVAIKFLQTNQPELTQRFLVEARTTARCQHDNIVVIYEVGEHNGTPYIVLEFLNGKPLTAYTESGQKLPYARAVEIMLRDPARAAVRARARHRPPRPQARQHLRHGLGHHQGARLRHREGAAAEAGPARRARSRPARIRMPSPLELATGTNTSLTRVGTIMGTLKYMSPEQWGIGIEIDHLTDIWACGILLHRMICGRHPLHPLDGNQLVVTAMLELPMPSMAEAAPPDVPARADPDRRPLPAQDEGAALAVGRRAARARSSRSCPAAAPQSSRSTRARTPACRRSRRPTPASSSAATARSRRWSPGSATGR